MDGEPLASTLGRGAPNRALLALVISTLVLLFVAIAVSAWSDNRQSRAIATLTRYQMAGYLAPEIITDVRRTYRLSAAVLDYSGAKTFGQVKQELRQIAGQLALEPHSIESRLTFAEYAAAIAKHLAAETRFKDRVVVNELPLDGSLGVFFLAADPESMLPGFAENTCAYLIGTTIIVCNADSIRRTLMTLDAVAQNMSTSVGIVEADGSLRVTSVGRLEIVRQFLKQNYLVWLLGHEIGHAQLHHATTNEGALHFDLRYDDREREADDFVVKAAQGDNAARAAFPVMLLEFIEQEFQARFVAQHGASARVVPAIDSPAESVVVSTPKHGVPLILRAMRIMDRTLADDKTALNRAAYIVVEGRIAYVGSIKFPEYYFFLKTKVTVPTETSQAPRSHAVPMILASALAALVVLGIAVHQARRGTR